MEVTVRALLKEGPLKNSRLVAGEPYIDYVVKGVTIMEAPDIVEWLAGGELLLTSFYSTLGSDIDYQEFVRKLVSKNVCALAIKVHRFVDHIPSEILETANEVGLPIIELDANTRFVDVMYPVMEMLFNKQVIALKYYKEVQEKFTALALQCEGLEKIVLTLEELIENPVAIYDNQGRCLQSTDEKVAQYKEITPLYEREIINEKLGAYRHQVQFPSLCEETVSRVVVPIQALSRIKAYLTVAELNRPLRQIDFICLEQAATVVTLDMVKRFAVREVEQKFSNDLIERLINGEAEPQNLREGANLLGWNMNHPFIVILFNVKNIDAHLAEKKLKQNSVLIQGVKEEIQSLISSVIKIHTPEFIIGHKSDFIIVLWPLKEPSQKAVQDINKASQEIQSQAKKKFSKISMSIGIGNVAAETQEIPRSYKAAQDALVFGEMLQGENVISSFQELGVYRLLCEFGKNRDLVEFIPEPLKKLQDYDEHNQGDLMKSLEVFLEYNGNATKAAKALFIHYKTLLYRLERIKEITALDLEDHKNRLELELGFKIMHLVLRN